LRSYLAVRGHPKQNDRPIGTRVEERRQFACLWIKAGDVRSLSKIAGKTCPREILRLALAAVLLRNDVVDMKRKLACGFWEETDSQRPAAR